MVYFVKKNHTLKDRRNRPPSLFFARVTSSVIFLFLDKVNRGSLVDRGN